MSENRCWRLIGFSFVIWENWFKFCFVVNYCVYFYNLKKFQCIWRSQSLRLRWFSTVCFRALLIMLFLLTKRFSWNCKYLINRSYIEDTTWKVTRTVLYSRVVCVVLRTSEVRASEYTTQTTSEYSTVRVTFHVVFCLLYVYDNTVFEVAKSTFIISSYQNK